MFIPVDRSLEAFPVDWWQYEVSCRGLMKNFEGHILSLLIQSYVDGTLKNFHYSGFLYDFNGALLWFTAGHVGSHIREMLTAANSQVQGMHWMDRNEISGAESVPVHRREQFLDYSYFVYDDNDDASSDIGIVLLTMLDAANIRANPKISPLGDWAWQNPNNTQPEGYYVIGFPFEHQTIDHNMFESQVRCLPAQRIVENLPTVFHGDANAFYGQLLPYIKPLGGETVDIVGMSGGPVWSVERENIGEINEQIVCRLIGIQSKWTGVDHRRIKVQPIQLVIELIKNLVEKARQDNEGYSR